MKLWKEFRDFAFKGNVIDLAVGVMIGAAFGSIVTSAVNDLFTPLISLITGKVDFSTLGVVMGSGDAAPVLAYGSFIQAVINFLLVAVCIFLFVKLVAKFRKPAPAAPADGGAGMPGAMPGMPGMMPGMMPGAMPGMGGPSGAGALPGLSTVAQNLTQSNSEKVLQLRRFDFVVQFAWKPLTPTERKQKKLEEEQKKQEEQQSEGEGQEMGAPAGGAPPV